MTTDQSQVAQILIDTFIYPKFRRDQIITHVDFADVVRVLQLYNPFAAIPVLMDQEDCKAVDEIKAELSGIPMKDVMFYFAIIRHKPNNSFQTINTILNELKDTIHAQFLRFAYMDESINCDMVTLVLCGGSDFSNEVSKEFFRNRDEFLAKHQTLG